MISPAIAFRVDASREMGAGHVMRCLTLADALRERGKHSIFICRDHQGHLGEVIAERGFQLELLPLADRAPRAANLDGYRAWLGDTPDEDAAATIAALAGQRPLWIVVDHYALAFDWETAISAHCDHLMVIDDLADRAHRCDLLLDQTFGRSTAAYMPLVAASTRVFCGAQFALLRPAFAALRKQSLHRRAEAGDVGQILVNLGGADSDNVTGAVLDGLERVPLPSHCRVKVVIGWQSPWEGYIRRKCEELSFDVDVLQGVANIAPLMAESDLAVGAAGSSTWERCCLGLPTVMIVVADNQQTIASELGAIGGVAVVPRNRLREDLPASVSLLLVDAAARSAMSSRAASIVDGLGATRVVNAMELVHAYRNG